jgi:hypothetical protein
MKTINLRQAVTAIENRTDFVAGAKTLRGFTNEQGEYVVYSYRALIACVKPNGRAWITDQKYSVTTSRHTGIVRRGLASVMIPQGLSDIVWTNTPTK